MGLGMSDINNFKPETVDPDSVERASFSMQHCTVTQQANTVLRSGKETQRALRRLRSATFQYRAHCRLPQKKQER